MPEVSDSSTPDLQRAGWAGKTWGLERAMALPLTGHRALACLWASVSLLSDEVTFLDLQL